MHWGLKWALIVGLMAAVPLTIYWVSEPPIDHLAQAKEAVAERDFVLARRELDRLLQQAPQHREALLLAAQVARRGGDGEAARRYLEAFRQEGGSQEEHEMEGVLRSLQEGEVANAVGLLHFCRTNPDNVAVYLMLEALAQGLLKAPNPRLAVECLDLWLKHPLSVADQVQAYVWRGQALDMMGLAPEAATDYRQALSRNAKHPEAQLRLAKFLARDQPAEALAIFQRLEQSSEVRLYRAKCHRMLGEFERASALLADLRGSLANDYSYLTETGALAIDQGQLAEAETYLRQAIAIAPKRRDANVELLRCLRAQRKDDDVKKQEAVVKEIDDELQRRIAGKSKP